MSMGIYLPNMEIPTKGYRLILVHADGTVQTTSGETTAVPVPPHGRLGDLDRLEQMFVDIDNAPYSAFDGGEPFYSAEDAAQIIRLAPTIILADDPKEEA